MKKILFISHEATLTGAPVLLYRLLQYIKTERPGWKCDILLQHSGGLYAALEKNFTVINYNTDPGIRFPQRLNSFLKKQYQKNTIRSVASARYDLVYSNTVVNGNLLESIRKIYKGPVIVHIHEMQSMMLEYGEKNLLQNLINGDHFITTSDIVDRQLNSLQEKYGYPKATSLVYPFIDDTHTITKKKERPYFIVGGSGNFTWRKGIEIFMFVARLAIKRSDSIKFVWVGGDHESIVFQRLNVLKEKLGIGNSFEFIAQTDSPEDIFKTFDLFFLSSVEEPFSMVSIECATMGTPLVCFNGCSGVSELMIPRAGFSFDLGDFQGIADCITGLSENAELMNQLSGNARAIVKENNIVTNNAAKIVGIIESCFSIKKHVV